MVKVALRPIAVSMLWLLALSVTACSSSLSDLKPGAGRKVTITGQTYDQLWTAAEKVAQEHFEVRQQDKLGGIIKAERPQEFTKPGAWIGIYIVPPVAAPTYTVEVVRLKKNNPTSDLGQQDWEYKVLRDMYRTLGLPALDPKRDP